MSKFQEMAKPSILDRLINLTPDEPYEPVQLRYADIDQIKRAVIRDLENLLNTRQNNPPLPPEFQQTNQSIRYYGLKDFSNESPDDQTLHKKICLELEELIAKYEPRLRQVTIQVEKLNVIQKNLRFRITALLVIEPIREPVAFDTFFDVTRREYIIRTQ